MEKQLSLFDISTPTHRVTIVDIDVVVYIVQVYDELIGYNNDLYIIGCYLTPILYCRWTNISIVSQCIPLIKQYITSDCAKDGKVYLSIKGFTIIIDV